MPGTERSLGLNDGRVERSIIGDRVVTGRSREHLVLPLSLRNVHIRHAAGAVASDRCVACTGWVQGVYIEGCTYRGVPRLVYS